MEGVRGWLLSVLTAGVVCAMAQTLLQPGPVRVVGKLTCGLVLACVLLTPFSGLDVAAGETWLEDYFASLSLREEELQQSADESIRAIIEEQFAAYILDKAARAGLDCTVRISCRAENGTWLPDGAEVSGPDGPRTARWLEEDLGIPPERQKFNEGEEGP